jgi:hypothetical protein
MPIPKIEDQRTLFWPKVHRISDGCCEWTGAKTGGGYGNFADRRRASAAHMFLWKNIMGLPYPQGYELHQAVRAPGGASRDLAAHRTVHVRAVCPAD